MSCAFISRLWLGLAAFTISVAAPAAQTPGAPSPAAQPAPSIHLTVSAAHPGHPAAAAPQATTPASTDTGIPLPDITARAVSDSDTLRGVESALSDDKTVIQANQEIQQLNTMITRFQAYTIKTLASNPELDTLRSMNMNWQKVKTQLNDHTHSLANLTAQLDDHRARVAQIRQSWQQTLATARVANTSDPLLQQVTGILTTAQQVQQLIDQQRSTALRLLDQIDVQKTRINSMLAAVEQARTATLGNLLAADRPPIWRGDMAGLLEQSHQAFANQFTALAGYARRHPQNFLFHGGLVALLSLILFWGRRQLRQSLGEDEAPRHATLVFDAPVAAATVLSILASGWIYPFAPRLWHAVLGALALIPTVILLRGLLERPLLPVLHALVIFYLADQLRSVTASMEWLSRLIFLAEMLGGMLFLAGWLLRLKRNVTHPATGHRWLALRSIAKGVLVIFGAAFFANVLGYTGLAEYLGGAVLKTSNLAVILYALVKAADGLIISAMYLKPLTLLAMVQRHRLLIRFRIHRALVWAGIASWAYVSLDILSLRVQLFDLASGVLAASLAVGPLHLSLANILAFVLSVWGAFLVSRFIRFLLEEDIYPRVSLASGLPYACSTLLHYGILFTGFIVALAELGFDMTKVTILAGAFGVGVGFGLQNIINNFVSGIILLFERPIKVGDMIQLGGQTGVVQRIGIRASVFRTADGSEIILPNSKLISDEVTNWTLSNRQRRVTVNVGVAHGTDLGQALAILKEAANADSRISDRHPPEALCVEFALESVRLELRVWTDRIEEWVQIRSDLAVAINAALLKDGIALRSTP